MDDFDYSMLNDMAYDPDGSQDLGASEEEK